jgi:cyclin-dependent kinase 12/13
MQPANTTTTTSEIDGKMDSQKDNDDKDNDQGEDEDDKEKTKNKDTKKKDKKPSKVNREREKIENSKRNEGGELPGCGNIYLVFEYVDHDLGGLIDAKYNFNPRAIKCIMKQLFEVLDYLSEKKIVHRDIKSSNILISNRYHVKLADFGLARSLVGPDGLREGKIDLTNNVITMWYKPPELLLGSQRYSHPVDMWSAGCVLAELELGRPLLPGKSEQQQLELICKSIGSPTEENWPGVTSLPNYEPLLKHMQKYNTTFRSTYTTVISDSVIGLLERILVVDPSRRTSARIALNNNYFLTPPTAPHDPAELEPLSVAGGASLHEFQTKQKRKQKEEALARGEVFVDDNTKTQTTHVNSSVTIKTNTQQSFQYNAPNISLQSQVPHYSYANKQQSYGHQIPATPVIFPPKVLFICNHLFINALLISVL